VTRLPIRLRLTLTSVGLLVAVLVLVLGSSWLLMARHLSRTLADDAYVDTVLTQLAWQYLLAVAGASLVVLGVGWAAAGRALAPLRRIAETARRIDDERLDERVRIDSGAEDEVREVATAFDAMLDRVAASVAGQQRFVANASHELRTPLTVIRTGAEVALDDPDASADELRAVLREAVETTERTEQLLEALLLLASLTEQRSDALLAGPVDLQHIAGRAVADAGAAATAAGMELQTDLRPGLVRGDEQLLERLVANLLENAIRHGAPGVIDVAVGHADGRVRVTVSSGGDVIVPEDLARITQPFERLRRGRRVGVGLGLSIVRAVAEAHGGRLLPSANPGGGLRVDVLLPAA
jgi:signal transduction histidine kinase